MSIPCFGTSGPNGLLVFVKIRTEIHEAYKRTNEVALVQQAVYRKVLTPALH